MLGQKEGLGQAMARKPQKQMCPGQTFNSWKEKNKSNDWQTNTSIAGYMKMPGESAWSQLSDSAASMFPLAPGWEDDFQDLSPFCQESQPNMSSVKVEDIKNFSSIVQDDELNTPEICIQNFEYPARENVLSRDNTTPTSLFEGGMWDIPPTIVSRQTSINEKIEDKIISNEVVEYQNSDEKCLQATKEVGSDQLNSYIGVTIDEMSTPSVAYEEEIVSTEDVIFEDSVTDAEMQSVLVYNKETECVQFIQTVSNPTDVTMIDPGMNDDLRDSEVANLKKIEYLLDNTILPPQESNNNVNVICESNCASNITNSVKMEVDNSLSSDLDFDFENNTENPVRNEIKVPVQHVENPSRLKTDLTLNLASILGTEDIISTPVLDSLIGEEISFDNLLEFIQPEMQDVKTQPFESASTVDFSEVSAVPYSNNNSITATNEITKEMHLNVKVVKPVVLKKSPDGKLSVIRKEVSSKPIKIEDGNRSGEQILPKKRFVKAEGKAKTVIITKTENTSELEGDNDASISPRRKVSGKEITVHKPRGRRPQQPSTSSSKSDTKYPSRQRKTSYRSDFDDGDSLPAKRARQSSVESEGGDKYRELRDKNNEASRKSRLNRKGREVEMKTTAERLEKENQSLRIKAEEMERLVKKLRQALLEAVTKTKK